jgi:hypothetical protein
MRILKHICYNVWLAVLYIVISLLVHHEVHPFTRMPMYDYPSKTALVFKVTDLNDSLIPTKQITTTNPGRLSHIYGTICKKYSINHLTTDKKDLKLIGLYLYESLKLPPNCPPIKIYRIQINGENGRVAQSSVLVFNSETDYAP